ncbi:MAG: adenylate kinase [Actinomycetota bacterium]|nr:adenylate kinase [Actinomycetota bacterium]
MRLVLLGPPGAGKGTQAGRIAGELSIPHIATGDLFRDNVKAETDLGRRAKDYMDRGDLVPDDIVIGMVRERLRREDASQGFVLDGFPRTVAQAEALEDVLGERSRALDAVLLLDIPEQEALRRITQRRTCPQCGANYHLEFAPPRQDGVCDECGAELVQREDDTEEVVRHRLEEYRSKTAPLESFYRERGLLRDVKAVGSVDEVTAEALDAVEQLGGGPA